MYLVLVVCEIKLEVSRAYSKDSRKKIIKPFRIHRNTSKVHEKIRKVKVWILGAHALSEGYYLRGIMRN